VCDAFELIDLSNLLVTAERGRVSLTVCPRLLDRAPWSAVLAVLSGNHRL
jgi:hypothetical protein